MLDHGTVTNLTAKSIFTRAFEGATDQNEEDPEGEFFYELHSGVAVPIATKMDQAWFLRFPEKFEVTVKNKVVSKATPESAKATTREKGDEVLKNAAKAGKP